VKRFIALAFCTVAVAAVVSSFAGLEPEEIGALSSNSGGLKGAGVTVPVDTFRLLVQDQDWVNQNAIDEGWIEGDSYYDQINESADLEDEMKWGCIDGNNPDSPRYGANSFGPITRFTAEDNAGQPYFLAFYAFRVDGLTSGHRVENAYVMINGQDFVTLDFTSGFIAVRLDTHVLDYQMITSTPPELDPSFMNITWNEVDAGGNVAWSPTMADRDDMHDWGPRGVIQYPGRVLPINGPVRIDVTDPIQQALDNNLFAETNGWAIFVLYHSGTSVGNMSWGISYTASRADGGNPCLTVETTSKRGPEPWGGGGIPFVLTFDDNYPEQQTLFQIMQAYNFQISTLITGALVLAGSPSYMDIDSLEAANPGEIKYVHHTLTHPGLGDLSLVELDPELGRYWIDSDAWFPTVDIDTTAVIDFAWAGSGVEQYGIVALERMIDYGYRSSRASGTRWTDYQATGLTTYFSWEDPVNMMLYQADFNVWEIGTAERTNAEIEEYITDRIDWLYTEQGKAAFMAFTHSYSMNKITPANLSYALNFINNRNGIQVMDFDDCISIRDGDRIAPSDIAIFNGGSLEMQKTLVSVDSLAIGNSAAKYDSLISLGGHDNLLEVWVNGK